MVAVCALLPFKPCTRGAGYASSVRVIGLLLLYIACCRRRRSIAELNMSFKYCALDSVQNRQVPTRYLTCTEHSDKFRCGAPLLVCQYLYESSPNKINELTTSPSPLIKWYKLTRNDRLLKNNLVFFYDPLFHPCYL